MRIFRILILELTLAWGAASAHAIEFSATPVQDSMRVYLFAQDVDDFGERKDKGITKTESDRQYNSSVTGEKSTIRAGLYSALLPGLGEFYVGHKEKARFFFAGEAVTWISFAAFRIYGNARQEDYINYAATHANARLENKTEEFHDLVGFYEDIDQYNSFGRVFDPDRAYLEDSPENHWRWQTEQDMNVYRNLKNRSREAFRRSEFVIGVAVVARVVSVIDAIRDAKRHNNRLDADFSNSSPVQLEFNPLSPTRQVVLTVRTPF